MNQIIIYIYFFKSQSINQKIKIIIKKKIPILNMNSRRFVAARCDESRPHVLDVLDLVETDAQNDRSGTVCGHDHCVVAIARVSCHVEDSTKLGHFVVVHIRAVFDFGSVTKALKNLFMQNRKI